MFTRAPAGPRIRRGLPSTSSVRFWIAFVFLNGVAGDRFPEHQSWWSHFRPSADVLVLLVVFAFCAAWQRRVPAWVRALLVGSFFVSRMLRFADGVEHVAYLRTFNLSLDLPLLPEFVRLFFATSPVWEFALGLSVTVLAIGGLLFAVERALDVCLRSMASPAEVVALAGLFAILGAIGAFLPAQALLAPSIVLRAARELEFAVQLPAYRSAHLQRIAAVQRHLQSTPHDLSRLHRADVYVFVVESYGECVLSRPELFLKVRPEYEAFETRLGAEGFQIASRLLDSPTYGGRSWLAQATLMTAVPTRDPLEFEILRNAQPRTLAQLFGDAGYRTVLAQPGTVRESSDPDLYHFQQHYFARDFGYRGPRFGWATMPDQFALETVRVREYPVLRTEPTLSVYALVSSHIPWSALPPVVPDWSTLGDGSTYRDWPIRHYVTHWLSLEGASDAYVDSIVYDLRILRDYIESFVRDDALLIVLGDHQPHSDVSAESPSAAVPIHVFSRNSAFVDRFVARGYTRGMAPDRARSHVGLETFMLDLIADFSKPGGTRE